MNRRRALLATTSIADNVFVIDDITFEEINMWGVSGYDIYIGNINTMNSLRKFVVENGYEYSVHGDYKIDPSQLELYLYDYKIPVTDVSYQLNFEFEMHCQEGVIPTNTIIIHSNNHVSNPSLINGEWTFDHIPTTSVEAILFVEFAKQYGVDAIKIDGYNVSINDGWNRLYIEPKEWITHSYTVYGANNGDLTGHIQYFEGEYS